MDIAVISSFPRAHSVHGSDTVGGASYAKNLLVHLGKIGVTSTIFGDILTNEQVNTSEHAALSIQRVWKRNSLQSILKLFRLVQSAPQNTVLVSFEVYMFGSLLNAAFFLLCLSVLKHVYHKKIFIILHQAPQADFFSHNPLVKMIIVPLLHIYYWWIHFSTYRQIVLEEHLKKIVPSRTAIFIPHAIENRRTSSKSNARALLKLNPNEIVVLFFGFISPYKGLTALLDAWDAEWKQAKLIIAGGPNSHHMQNSTYASFISKITHIAQQKNVAITGFVPEDAISSYFSAADCVILPYDAFMSSSGPLSLALAYEKPIVLSTALKAYLQSPDFDTSLRRAGLSYEDVFTSIDTQSLKKSLMNAHANAKKFSVFARYVKEERSWEKIALKFAQLLTS